MLSGRLSWPRIRRERRRHEAIARSKSVAHCVCRGKRPVERILVYLLGSLNNYCVRSQSVPDCEQHRKGTPRRARRGWWAQSEKRAPTMFGAPRPSLLLGSMLKAESDDAGAVAAGEDSGAKTSRRRFLAPASANRLNVLKASATSAASEASDDAADIGSATCPVQTTDQPPDACDTGTLVDVGLDETAALDAVQLEARDRLVEEELASAPSAEAAAPSANQASAAAPWRPKMRVPFATPVRPTLNTAGTSLTSSPSPAARPGRAQTLNRCARSSPFLQARPNPRAQSEWQPSRRSPPPTPLPCVPAATRGRRSPHHVLAERRPRNTSGPAPKQHLA